MKKVFNLAFAVVIMAFSASIADANPITTKNDYSGSIDFGVLFGEMSTIDHGNAPGYGDAKNTMGIWQRLGTPGDNTDGVSWSVDGSDYGTTANLIQGREVTFKYELWQSNNGTHPYDQIISFLDWDHDKIWSSSERLIYEQIDAKQNPNNDNQENENFIEKYDTLTTIFYTLTVADDAILGDTWLRTRVHCNHLAYPNITAYNNLYQGETLDHKLTIVSESVPEPATMLLFGTGLVGLAGIGRRKNNK